MSKKSRGKQNSRRSASSPKPAVAVTRADATTRTTAPSLKKSVPSSWQRAYSLVPVALAFLTSANSIWNQFASDDTQQVLGNIFIKRLSNLPLAFTTSVWSFVSVDIAMAVQSYYRPLFSVLFTINYAFFGTSAWGWHLMNVVIHAAVTALVFVVCKEVTGRAQVAGITAALFAVHPVHVESVAWISGVTDPLMALFLLPAFYFYLRYKKTGGKYMISLTVLLYLLALWSKESAIALPLVIGYCELFHFTESTALRGRIARVMMWAALFLLPSLLYFFMRQEALGASLGGYDDRFPLGSALATIPLATVKYLLLMTVPIGYSYQHYTSPVASITSLNFLLPAIVLVALALGITLTKSRTVRLGAVWFICMLAPALLAIRHFDAQYIVQERYLYMASMGFVLVLAVGIERLSALEFLRGQERAAALITLLLVLIWGPVSVAQNRVWHDTLTLFKNCVAIEPRSPEAHSALAGTYFAVGRPREAEAEARLAMEIDPACANAYTNLSYFSKQAGKLDQAIDYLEQATRAVPLDGMTRVGLATVHLNLGLLCSERRDFACAEQHVVLSTQLWDRAVGWYYAGEYYFGQGRYEEARQMYERAMKHLPSRYAPIHRKIGLAWEGLRQADQARAEYEKYLQLASPDAADREDVQNRLSRLPR